MASCGPFLLLALLMGLLLVLRSSAAEPSAAPGEPGHSDPSPASRSHREAGRPHHELLVAVPSMECFIREIYVLYIIIHELYKFHLIVFNGTSVTR